jgi:phosphoenolpyruvate carboxykinase (GTP)
MWPGFGDNIRVMKWVISRIEGKAGTHETPLGNIPDMKDFDLSGLDIPQEKIQKLFSVNPSEWTEELQEIEKYLEQFGNICRTRSGRNTAL